MRAKRKDEKKSKSKSLEKRPPSRRQDLNMFLDAEINCCDKSKAFIPDIPEHRNREARSQQGSRRAEKRASNESRLQDLDLLLYGNKHFIKDWEEPELKTTLREKPSKQNFTVLHVIGKGGFGKVWKVKDRKNAQEYAMKEMSKALILTKKSQDSVANERELLTKVKHQLIVNMRQAFQDRDNLYLVMDLMPGGDLRYHICKKHKFTEQQARFFAACIFTGLEYLHQNRIIHRDLKPENLVLDDLGYIHITDLGIAKYLKSSNYSDTSGTPGYMAPEVMCRQNHSYEVDYYALGVILYEIMMGRRPYLGKTRKDIQEQILAKQTVIKKSDIPEGWSVEAADFINKLIQRKPMMRLGWGGSHEVKKHSWLRDFPWELLDNYQVESPFRKYSKYNPHEVRYQQTVEDEELNQVIRENMMLLRKSSVQQLFKGYTYDDEIKLESYTTSSELHRRRDAEEPVSESTR